MKLTRNTCTLELAKWWANVAEIAATAPQFDAQGDCTGNDSERARRERLEAAMDDAYLAGVRAGIEAAAQLCSGRAAAFRNEEIFAREQGKPVRAKRHVVRRNVLEITVRLIRSINPSRVRSRLP